LLLQLTLAEVLQRQSLKLQQVEVQLTPSPKLLQVEVQLKPFPKLQQVEVQLAQFLKLQRAEVKQEPPRLLGVEAHPQLRHQLQQPVARHPRSLTHLQVEALAAPL